MTLLKLNLKNPLTVLVAALIFTIPHSANAQDVYVEHFKAYQAAQAAGDTTTARIEAEAAWKSAEAELGDSKLTAILAYNFGSMMTLEDPQASIKPLKRAKAIGPLAGGDVPLKVVDAYLDYAAYMTAPDNKKAVKLRDSLNKIVQPDGTPQISDAFMWMNMANIEAKALRLWTAEPAAQKVVEALKSVGLDEDGGPALNNALIIRAAAGLSGRERTDSRIAWSLDDLDRVIESFKKPKDADELDPILATALAWKGVAFQILEDKNLPLPDPDEIAPLNAAFSSYTGAPENCNIQWIKNKPANFRGSGVFPGYVGGALISYDITSSGKIKDAKLIAQVPNGQLGREAMKAFKKWELAGVPEKHKGCRTNQIASFVYHAEWPAQ